jgi:alpha-tubulin suppressor-like RCC1 family protein
MGRIRNGCLAVLVSPSRRLRMGWCLVVTLVGRVATAQADGGGFVDLAGARAVDLSVNIQGACAVTDAGRLICWGNNSHGALGPVKEIDRLPPTLRPDVTDAVRVFLADSGGCVARRSGAINCWGIMPGRAAERFLGGGLKDHPTTFSVSTDHGCGVAAGKVRCWGWPPYLVAVRDPVQVSTGPFQNCARDRRGAVWCWGGSGGGLATPPPLSGVLPSARVPGIAGAVDLSVSAGRNCVALASGKVNCWQTLASPPKLEQIAGLDDAIAVSASANDGCAIRRDGGVACWGYDNVARPVPNLANVVQLASGFNNTCARLVGGAVLCLGPNSSRELGVETQTESTTPVRVSGVDAVAIAAGYALTCAIGRDGGLVCWGATKMPGVGAPVPPETLRPRHLPGTRDLVQVVADNRSVCALSRSGQVSCWSAALDPQRPLVASFDKVPVRSITLGPSGVCAVTVAGDVLCPDRVDVARGSVQAVAGERDFGCALKPSGEVACWGAEIPARETFVPGVAGWTPPSVRADSSPHVIKLPAVRQLAARGSRLCSVFTDGRVFCPPGASDWKYLSPPTSFVPIGAVRSIAVASHQACAILASGQVGCWGENAYGQLGTGKLGPWPPAAPPPIIEPIAGLDRIVALSVGEYHACAVRADGAVFCWGVNWGGQLGLGTIGFRATP